MVRYNFFLVLFLFVQSGTFAAENSRPLEGNAPFTGNDGSNVDNQPGVVEALADVAAAKGLIAFWDFSLTQDGKWTSHHDDDVFKQGYRVDLRRIGDANSYTPETWPYKDAQSELLIDDSGPFGQAVRFNQGYIFAEVPRSEFDRSPLDIHGDQPFTLIAWIKFIGKRHLVAGIWDEGGWVKYGGRRQLALFGGLFGSQGVIGHISTTGAASYPQATIPGSQYARCRAIDGQNFPNNEWVSVAMTFDPITKSVTAYCNGIATPTQITDPVAKHVFHYTEQVASNPYHFPWSIYSPRSFVLKFNGYDVQSSGVYEHWIHVNSERGTVTYDRSCPNPTVPDDVKSEYRIGFEVKREGEEVAPERIVFRADVKKTVELPDKLKMKTGDQITTSLEMKQGDHWERVGQEIQYRIREGAPFTFGRALGLGSEPIDHGAQLFIDGVAVFNRVLDTDELKKLSFTK